MADDVKKTNPVIKILVILIASVLGVLIVGMISLYIFKTLINTSTEKERDKEVVEKIMSHKEVKATFPLPDEFQIPTKDSGIVVIQVELCVNTEDTVPILESQLSKIKDEVNRCLMELSMTEIKELSIAKDDSSNLRGYIAKRLNKRLKNDLGVKKEGIFFKVSVKREIVQIYIKKIIFSSG